MNSVPRPMSPNASSPSAQKAQYQQALSRLAASDRGPLAQWLRGHLFGHVLPFWERHAFDPQGGLCTCVSEAGEVVSTDKWLWSQWRAVWVFSRIYRTLERDEKWLRRARDIAEFCIRTGWDRTQESWVLLVARDGTVLRGCESTYVDAFAVYGLTELYAAGGDQEILRWACRTADAALKKLTTPYDRIPHFPYPIPTGAKPHGIPMLWSLAFAELGRVAATDRYLDAARRLSEEIFQDFYRPARDLVVEFVALDGGELPPPIGTAVVPGHVIEDVWFQAHVAKLTGAGPARLARLWPLLQRHLRLGWDQTLGGGLLLAVDADNRPEVGWGFADTKLWWPHTEALYSTLLAWDKTRDEVFLTWYQRLWDVCLEHYVDWTNGEWRQKLDRSLQPLDTVVALPVKDPFHLPRSLILQIELLEGSNA